MATSAEHTSPVESDGSGWSYDPTCDCDRCVEHAEWCWSYGRSPR